MWQVASLQLRCCLRMHEGWKLLPRAVFHGPEDGMQPCSIRWHGCCYVCSGALMSCLCDAAHGHCAILWQEAQQTCCRAGICHHLRVNEGWKLLPWGRVPCMGSMLPCCSGTCWATVLHDIACYAMAP
jgi:hypothetical protein